MDELGALPETLANQCRALMQQDAIPNFARLAPHMINAIEVYHEILI